MNILVCIKQVPVVSALAFDPVTSSTRLLFDPAADLPSAGGGPSPLKVVVGLSKEITDLVGNPVAAPQQIFFVPER